MTFSNQNDTYYLEKHYADGAAGPIVLPSDGSTTLTLPDMHGNVLGAILRLEAHGVLKIKDGDRKRLGEIYQNGDVLTEQELEDFKRILDNAEFYEDKFKCVRFIGDILADRGKNDIFMLYLLENLKKRKVNTEVILSNHDLHFMAWVLAKGNLQEKNAMVGKLGAHQEKSLENLALFLEKNPAQKDEVARLFKDVYTPMLKVFHGSVKDPFAATLTLILDDHAPVGIEAIQGMAGFLFKDNKEFKFEDSPLDALLETINKVNTAFQELMHHHPDKLIEQLKKEQASLKKRVAKGKDNPKPKPIETPIHYAVWNRRFKYIKGPRNKSYNVYVKNGHAGDKLSLNWIANGVTGINLDKDNTLGWFENGAVSLGDSGALNCYRTLEPRVALVNGDEKSILSEIKNLQNFDHIVVLTQPPNEVINALLTHGIDKAKIRIPEDIQLLKNIKHTSLSSALVVLDDYFKKLNIGCAHVGMPSFEEAKEIFLTEYKQKFENNLLNLSFNYKKIATLMHYCEVAIKQEPKNSETRSITFKTESFLLFEKLNRLSKALKGKKDSIAIKLQALIKIIKKTSFTKEDFSSINILLDGFYFYLNGEELHQLMNPIDQIESLSLKYPKIASVVSDLASDVLNLYVDQSLPWAANRAKSCHATKELAKQLEVLLDIQNCLQSNRFDEAAIKFLDNKEMIDQVKNHHPRTMADAKLINLCNNNYINLYIQLLDLDKLRKSDRLDPMISDWIGSLIGITKRKLYKENDIISLFNLFEKFNTYLDRVDNFDLNKLIEFTMKLQEYHDDFILEERFADKAVDLLLSLKSPQVVKAQTLLKKCCTKKMTEVDLICVLHQFLKSSQYTQALDCIQKNASMIAAAKENPTTEAKKLLSKVVYTMDRAAPNLGLWNAVKEKTLGYSNGFFDSEFKAIETMTAKSFASLIGGVVTDALPSMLLGVVDGVRHKNDLDYAKNQLACEKLCNEFNFDAPVIKPIYLPPPAQVRQEEVKPEPEITPQPSLAVKNNNVVSEEQPSSSLSLRSP